MKDLKRVSESVQFHDEMDMVSIDGVKVSGDLLRTWTQQSKPGRWFRIIKREDGVITVEQRYDERLQ